MEENKQEIADKLAELLKITRRFHDIERIKVIEIGDKTHSEEFAEVYIKNNDAPYRRICITADSGIAMIKDIIQRLCRSE